jgi:radical SAM protein with 4Fe4S-binding SPASM domain
LSDIKNTRSTDALEAMAAHADASKIVKSLSLLAHMPGLNGMLSSMEDCETCGINHIELGIEEYLGHERSNRCLKGKMVSKLVAEALRKGIAAFGVEDAQVREALKDPYTRRGLLSVLKGIGKFGIKEPFTPGAPFLVVWNLTNSCNLKCAHCYQNANRALADELTTEEKLKVIDDLCREGVVAIAFSGGEPLMARDFYTVAEYAYKKGMAVSVATNGTLVTEQVAKRMKECGVCYVDVSLDGASASTHDAFRGISGLYERTLQGIRNLVSAGIDTCVATTAVNTNYHEIPRIVDIAKQLGVKRFMVFNFIPSGRGANITASDLSPMQREGLLKYLYNTTQSTNITALCTAPQFSRVSLQMSHESGKNLVSPTHFAAVPMPGKLAELSRFIGGCGAGRMYCAIQPNGAVTPCVFMPTLVLGSLKNQSFGDIWSSHAVLADLRDRARLKGACKNCEYRSVCGGCRARAYGYYGDLLASDPGCILIAQELNQHSMEAIYSAI